MSDPTTQLSSRPNRRWLWIALAVAILAAVVVLLVETDDTANVTVKDAPAPAPTVTFLEVAPADTTATISAFAELRPRWDAEIRSAVAGRITVVHDTALAGERVAAGTPLFAIERTQYETAVAAAELSLEEAKLSLWRAQNAVLLARREFERTGTEPPNDLALRLPELHIAERTVASAEAQLEAAQRQLADTVVMAPFSGFITVRMVSLGQTVSAGEALVHLSDDRQYEMTVELGQAEWALLDHPVAGQRVVLKRRDGAPIGEARIRQGGGFLDPQTRQRRLFLDVINPTETILAGDFVQVAIEGRTIADTLTIPESALTRAGHVWIVDVEDMLMRLAPDILFRSGDKLTISAPEGSGPYRIAITPLASFLPGQRVTPQPAED
ncbi:efflux RND transporter periplasmic adaptor subunit [Oricola sp.]|uniref:efflux RND transporter periplasmic adaptor subunit n=1 Tax=Oricola sp. TaxID=1979950 RepID=UPI003BAD900A